MGKGRGLIGKNNTQHRINEQIYIKGGTSVRLIPVVGESYVCHINEARELANQAELDLVEINGNINPPILKICDYGKFLYEIKKNNKSQKPKPLKEIQLSVSISQHDMETKANSAKKFILDGSKVRVVLAMKGREKTHREANKKSLYEFLAMMEDVAVPESLPKDEGDSKTVVFLKKKK